MTQFRGRITNRQLQILGLAWLIVVLMVGACVFLGIYFAMQPRTVADANTTLTPTTGLTATATQIGAPTQVVAAGQTTPIVQATIPPRQDKSFGYGIQAQTHINTDQTLDQVQQLGLGWVKQQI